MDILKKSSISAITLTPVILAGGSGSRLWPLSRSSYPKQYLRINEENNFSLLQNTMLRLKGIKNVNNPIIICNEEQRFIVAEQMREIKIIPQKIILEPLGKNTAPAITLAALEAFKVNQDSLLLILSSDHEIKDEAIFRKVIEDGINYANKGRLVTFGVPPTRPDTGFGYIQTNDELTENLKFSKIKKFVEKPKLEIAEKMIQDKHYLWNSGIFLFKACVILKELEKFEPKMLNFCRESLEKGLKDLEFQRIDEASFSKCSGLPIDIAVMEKTDLGTVLTLNARWNDVGSWKAIWENSNKDNNGNTLKGKIIVKQSLNSYIRSEDRLIVGLGIKDLIIIDTEDAILISHKETAHEVKKVVEELNKNNFSEGKLNKKTYRPWGSFTSIEKGESWQVKRLEIKPKASLSLQMHHHRAEHWVVVNGTAKIEIDEKISILSENESIYVPLGSKHRLSNPGKLPLILIEIQSGNYLGEDDIVRFEDNYGRLIRENST